MPQQNLGVEILLALAIWLLPTLVFAIMLVLAIARIISEERASPPGGQKPRFRTWERLRHATVRVLHRRR